MPVSVVNTTRAYIDTAAAVTWTDSGNIMTSVGCTVCIPCWLYKMHIIPGTYINNATRRFDDKSKHFFSRILELELRCVIVNQYVEKTEQSLGVLTVPQTGGPPYCSQRQYCLKKMFLTTSTAQL